MIYYYKSKYFDSMITPICNICGHDLVIKYGYKKNTIIKCSNSNCNTNVKNVKRIILYKAFLPKYFVEEYKKTLNNLKYSRPNSKEYWLKKGYSKREAKEKVKERQTTFSLDICIKKHGKERGIEIFNERQKKWQNALRKNFEKEGDGRSLQSKWANNLIKKICEEFNIEIPKKEKWINGGDIRCSYDFTYKKKIIEFNGDYWHGNPNLYNENDKIINQLVKERWEYDTRKIDLAKSKGYDVLVIWEYDYNNHPNLTFKKCIKFLKN